MNTMENRFEGLMWLLQEGFVAENPKTAVMVAEELAKKFGQNFLLLKLRFMPAAEKGGGVRLAKSPAEAASWQRK